MDVQLHRAMMNGRREARLLQLRAAVALVQKPRAPGHNRSEAPGLLPFGPFVMASSDFTPLGSHKSLVRPSCRISWDESLDMSAA
jgi:hypothetical protein